MQPNRENENYHRHGDRGQSCNLFSIKLYLLAVLQANFQKLGTTVYLHPR